MPGGPHFTTSQKPPTELFDPDSVNFFAKTIIASALSGGVVGGLTGFSKNLDPFAVAYFTGCKWVAVAAGFFGTREFVVSPLLVYAQATRSHARRYNALVNAGQGSLDFDEPTVGEMRNDRVLDSSLAGGLAFGTWTAISRGPKLVPRAAFTAALVTGLGQYTINFARVSRLKLLARHSDPSPPPNTSLTPSQLSLTPGSLGAETPVPGLTEQLRQSTREPTTDVDVKGEQTIPGRILGMMSYIAPVKRINQQELLETLMKRRDELDGRLREIEAEEERLFELVQRGEAGRAEKEGGHVV